MPGVSAAEISSGRPHVTASDGYSPGGRKLVSIGDPWRPASFCAHADQRPAEVWQAEGECAKRGRATTAIVQNRQKNGVYQQASNHSSLKYSSGADWPRHR